MPAEITISHDHEHGTTLTGSTKGDGVWEIARTHGFHYSRTVGIYIRGSRDRIANRHLINACADALRAAGHTVEVTIDDQHRDRATVIADKADRLEDRADALAAKATRRATEAAASWALSDRLVEHIPAGQPILVGHHSERHHRRTLERSQNAAFRGLALDRQAQEVAQRAEAVGKDASYAATPAATALRIPRLETELRDLNRKIDGYVDRWGQKHSPAEGDAYESLSARAAQVRDQLDHDRMLLARAVEAGTWTPYGPDTIQAGDLISTRTSGPFRRVVKVNRKTVAVESGYSWTDKVPFEAIRRHHRPSNTEPTA